MILVYVNKPALGAAIINALGSEIKEAYPNQKIVVINQKHTVNLHFQYPKNLTWSSYPYVGEPIYKFTVEENWINWKPCEVNEDNKLIPITITTKEIQEVKTIIYADDPHSTHCHNFDLFLKYFFKDKIVDIPALILSSLDCASMLKSWKERKNFYEVFSQSVKRSIIKRYFNYNYNVNALGILGYILKEIGVSSEKNYLSKYELQLLYKLKELAIPDENDKIITQTEGKILMLMGNWKGSGKYERKSHWHGNLGSVMSKSEIMKNLINMQLVNKTNGELRNEIRISPLGELFLSKLHKDCLDKDLPFRYQLWQEKSIEEVKPKIDEYIKKFFGKQKRKMDKV